MHFVVVASGSKGNATLIFDKDTLILIDMGIPLSRLEAELFKYKKTINDIDGIIFTHEHTDHINGLRFLKTKKMYALEGTLPSTNSNQVFLFETFKIKNICITPIPTSHDAINPCGYILEGSKKMVYMTDTGKVCENAMKYCRDANFILIESNHDIAMLLKSNRSYDLKMRILSEYGHLSNEDSALACVNMLSHNTEQIVLMHLSEECNTKQKALNAFYKTFKYYGINIDKYRVFCSDQWTSTYGGDPYEN